MLILKGIPASPGIAIGPAYMVEHDGVSAERKEIPPAAVAQEVRRFRTAVERTLDDLDKGEIKVREIFGDNYAQLMEAHKLILKDPMLTDGVVKKIEAERISAETALYAAVREIIAGFENIKDEFFRERKFDVADVAKRVFENLTERRQNKFADIKEPSIVIAHNLYPSDTFRLKSKKVLGFATDIGGKTSHTAILAQSMQMPAVVGLSNAAAQIRTGDILILDGQSGALIINPDASTLETYKKQQGEFARAERSLKDISNLPNITKDGHKVLLYINYDPRRDNKEWDTFHSEGLGLLRTEFIFMDRPEPPPEEEQFAVYKKAVQRFGARPVTIRLADLGGDKAAGFGLARAEEEDNPFMGCRGIRFFLKYPELMKTQMRAIIRAASVSHGQVNLMVPMVSGAGELAAVREVFGGVLADMRAKGVQPALPIKIGAMIEVPSAALTMDAVLPEADFVSIGTNDLIQYILAVDRVNQEVADLYDPYHPAVLRTINFVVQAARKKGRPVSICGEMASDPEMVPFLVGVGVDILSVTPRMFLRIKNTLRNLNFKDCANLAQAAILMTSSEEIKKLKENYRTDEEII
ncbi:MAG: phosphoenolpyruvate--protein phosphotransferase [Elusimicrobiota bacterium]|jgi:phosphotransferase system enzyme I (PtsI)|nr:phosphoenolpyruvate--protein phosphotransferase [Elusimicrobiota bacterium]